MYTYIVISNYVVIIVAKYMVLYKFPLTITNGKEDTGYVRKSSTQDAI